ncbi:MAG: hypothetical protein LBP95_05405 [Deltaproteobacteria bacterium]|jgi:hypothetical protein|nr:hypothetical protein [Deltaproteobacteria bacterium]
MMMMMMTVSRPAARPPFVDGQAAAPGAETGGKGKVFRGGQARLQTV